MSNVLIAYFSASGTTADAAEKIAEVTGYDIVEIRPKVPYTEQDLNWQDQNSRSSLEMKDKSSRPEIEEIDIDLSKYDTVLLGLPIWWYTAPTIVNTFLEKYDISDKKIILFATSGSSDFENTVSDLKKSLGSSADISEGIVIHGKQNANKWKKWVESLNL